MNIYSIPKGIQVNNSQFTLVVLAITATACRYRRFIFLLVICCAIFFAYGWYTNTEETRTLNESDLTARIVNPDTNLEDLGIWDRYQTEQWKVSDDLSYVSSANEWKSPFSRVDEKGNVLDSNENRFRQPIKALDFIPNEESVTFSNHRVPDFEFQFSNPPESFLFPKLPMHYQDMELENSDLTETTFLKIKPSTNYHPDMENSDPTQFVRKKNKKPINIVPYRNIKAPKNGYSSKINNLKLTTESETHVFNVTKPVKNAGLIIDTPGCKIPELDPWDPTVIDLYEKLPPLNCPGPPLFMKSQPDGSITIDKKILRKHYNLRMRDISCFYQGIRRKHEEPEIVRENDYYVINVTDMIFGVPLNEDYVGVMCYMKNKSSDRLTEFHQYFPLVRLKPEVEKQKSPLSPPEHKLNIILAGIDSVSKLNFLRHFPKTHAFIKEKMTAFDMRGYNKVGDNTFPNLVPLLTGRFVQYYWNESFMDTMYFDHLDFIWKDYAEKGYRTFYAEDHPWAGTFQYLKRGFYDPPTDYYMRPLALAVEQLKYNRNYQEHCLNSQIETELVYDYLRDFIQAMGPRPHFAFSMVSRITHDILNKAGWEDEPTLHLLESLHENGALNNSMLVLFSDHGLRFGPIRERYIGKFEERMPVMFVHFPKWFLDQHPQLAKNLKDNQERLITLFDVHATMIDLLDLKARRTPEEWLSFTQGTSLLREISPNRTCEEANILTHWCSCQTYEEVPLNDDIAVNCAQAIVDDINMKLEPFNNSCAVLEIDKISDARLGQANDLVLRFVQHDHWVVNGTVIYGDKVDTLGDYLITLKTKPGGAVFEGTVRYNLEIDSYSVLGISRINMYGNQSWCINSQKMKIFCYCNT